MSHQSLKNLSIALLVVGALRGTQAEFQANLDAIRANVVQHHDADVFCSFNGFQSPAHVAALRASLRVVWHEELADGSWRKSAVFSCDAAARARAEYTKFSEDHRLRALVSPRFHLERCMRALEESSRAYDAIVWLRTDCLMPTPMPWDVLWPSIARGLLCVPNDHDHLGINDRFAAGGHSAMYFYTSQVHALDTLVCKSDTRYNPEIITARAIEAFQLPIVRFQMDVQLNYS